MTCKKVLFKTIVLALGLFASAVSCSLTGSPSARPVEPVLVFDKEGRLDQSMDLALRLYRDPFTRPKVSDYFYHLTGSPDLADTILEVCDDQGLAPTLAFALAWTESRFNPRAIGYNRGSIDRGLFQLNSRAFPHIGYSRSLDPWTNAKVGLGHFKMLLEQTRDLRKALSAYNAGLNRVLSDDIPAMTVAYADRTLASARFLAGDLQAHLFSGRAVIALAD